MERPKSINAILERSTSERSKARLQNKSARKTVPTVLKGGELALTLTTRQNQSRDRGVEPSLEYSSCNNVVNRSIYVSIIAWLVTENVKVYKKNQIIDQSWEVRLAVRWEPSIASHTFRPFGEGALIAATHAIENSKNCGVNPWRIVSTIMW